MIYDGGLVFLQLRLGDAWQDIGGMLATSFSINQEMLDISEVGCKWRKLISKGLFSINISLAGIFTGSAGEQALIRLSFKGNTAEYRLNFADNEQLEGWFLVSRYERFADIDEEESYKIILNSAGEVKFIQLIN